MAPRCNILYVDYNYALECVITGLYRSTEALQTILCYTFLHNSLLDLWNLKLLRQFLDHPAWHHTSRAGKGQIMGRGGEQQGDAHVGARADQNCKYLPAGCAPTALELQPGAAIPNTAKVREAEGKESWQGSVAAARWRVAHRPATQATRHQRVRQEATEGVV